MLSLIFISLKQNTSLLMEAQLKHGGNRQQGLQPLQRCLQDSLQVASPGPFCGGSLSISRDKGCKNAGHASPALTAAEGKAISKGASGLIHTKRDRGGRLDLATCNPSSQNPTL